MSQCYNSKNFYLKYNLGLLTEIKYSTTKHKMYPDGGRKWARAGMRNKLFSLHGLSYKNFFGKMALVRMGFLDAGVSQNGFLQFHLMQRPHLNLITPSPDITLTYSKIQ